MTAPTLEPLVVFDAHEETYLARRGTAWHGQFIDWLRSHGINPDQTYRVEVYLLDAPFARVFEYALDTDGRRIIVGDDYAHREPYDVVLSSLPPAPAVPGEEDQ